METEDKKGVVLSLEKIRGHFDRLDKSIIILPAERLSFMPKVAEYKLKNKLLLFQKGREEEQNKKIKKLAEEFGLNCIFTLNLFDKIKDEAKRIQKEILDK